MPYRKNLVAAGLLLGATFNANASLTSYTANGVDFVRMQGAGFDVSFTKDGNLFQTLAANNANLVSQISAVTPSYNDSYYGLQTIDASDFSTSTGTMTWWGGKAFVNYLNTISYGGSNQWSLPGWIDTGAAGPQTGNSGTDSGYNVNPSSSPLAQLYYGELANKGYYDTGGYIQTGYGIFGNDGAQVAGGAIGPFSNVQSYVYLLGMEFAPGPYWAWNFSTGYGTQGPNPKTFQFYAWAVSPGQVAAVPVPGAIWLMGSGLLGLVSLKRRGHAG